MTGLVATDLTTATAVSLRDTLGHLPLLRLLHQEGQAYQARLRMRKLDAFLRSLRRVLIRDGQGLIRKRAGFDNAYSYSLLVSRHPYATERLSADLWNEVWRQLQEQGFTCTISQQGRWYRVQLSS